MFIIKHKKIFICFSATLVILSIASFFVFGVKVGIDFKGGAITEVSYTDIRPDHEILNQNLEKLNFGSMLLQPVGEQNYIVKSRDLNKDEHTLLLQTLSFNNKELLTEVSFNSIGPSVGHELTKKALVAVILVSIALILFIAFAFRKVAASHILGRQAVPSWKYGFIAIITLLHDVIISVGVFILLSNFFGVEVNTLFVVAILTILGLSVSDTIVIFDRIRENLKNSGGINKINFGEIVGHSLRQSFARSIATSLSTIIVLLTLVFFGPASTKYFALMLTAGMFLGTYSSIFLASPLLVWVEELQNKK